MATALITQGAERIALVGRKRIEHPMRRFPETELSAVVLMHHGLIAHCHTTDILIGGYT